MGSTLRALGHELWRLAQAWWQVDRVRRFSGHGRLAKLRPSARLLVQGALLEVRHRTATFSPEGPMVVYHGDSGGQIGEVRIAWSEAEGPPRLWWRRDGPMMPLCDDEIEILSQGS